MTETQLLAGRALMRLEQDGTCWVWRGANDGAGVVPLHRRIDKWPPEWVCYEFLRRYDELTQAVAA